MAAVSFYSGMHTADASRGLDRNGRQAASGALLYSLEGDLFLKTGDTEADVHPYGGETAIAYLKNLIGESQLYSIGEGGTITIQPTEDVLPFGESDIIGALKKIYEETSLMKADAAARAEDFNTHVNNSTAHFNTHVNNSTAHITAVEHTVLTDLASDDRPILRYIGEVENFDSLPQDDVKPGFVYTTLDTNEKYYAKVVNEDATFEFILTKDAGNPVTTNTTTTTVLTTDAVSFSTLRNIIATEANFNTIQNYSSFPIVSVGSDTSGNIFTDQDIDISSESTVYLVPVKGTRGGVYITLVGVINNKVNTVHFIKDPNADINEHSYSSRVEEIYFKVGKLVKDSYDSYNIPTGSTLFAAATSTVTWDILGSGSIDSLGTEDIGGEAGSGSSTTYTPIHLDGGIPTASTTSIGSSTRPVFMLNGQIKQCSKDLGNACSRDVSTSIALNPTSAKLPTCAAVSGYVNTAVQAAVSALGTVFRFMGGLPDIESLATQSAQKGDVWNIEDEGAYVCTDVSYTFTGIHGGEDWTAVATSLASDAISSFSIPIYVGNGSTTITNHKVMVTPDGKLKALDSNEDPLNYGDSRYYSNVYFSNNAYYVYRLDDDIRGTEVVGEYVPLWAPMGANFELTWN